MTRRFGMKQRTGRKRSKCTAVTWTLLAAVTAACIAVGSCALWLPDRTPTLLSSAGERTVAPASVQEYAGTQQVTVVPTIPVTVTFPAMRVAWSPRTGPATA